MASILLRACEGGRLFCEPRAVILAGRLRGRLPRFLSRFLHRFLTSLLGLGARLALGAEIFKFVIGKMFDTDKGIVRSADSDEFIELHLNGCAISVLRVLD